MRTLDRLRGRRTSVWTSLRPITMLAFLAALGLMIYRASDPETWRFLDRESRSRVAPAETKPVQLVADNDEAVVTPGGPTDDSPEEVAAAFEEAQAVSDNGLQLEPEEMPLYWRIFGWVQRQPYSLLQKRAMKDPVMNQFMQSPNETRGRIVELKLNIRRILRYDAPENSAGVKSVYEIWGWTDESQAWPYVVLTSQLPNGMPIGANVHERATFAGYFFKLQGYLAAGAKPNDKPLSAPLLIGRVAWSPSPLRAEQKRDFTWLWLLGIGAAVFGVFRLGIWKFGRKPAAPNPVEITAADAERIRDWLNDDAHDLDNDSVNSYDDRPRSCGCGDKDDLPPFRPLYFND